MKNKLTDPTVARLPLPARGNREYVDRDLQGFGVRVSQGGGRTYFIRYRDAKTRKQYRHNIGRAEVISADRARREARRLLGEIESGHNPATARQAYKEGPTVKDLIARYLSEATGDNRPGTVCNYTLICNKHIAPRIGGLKVIDVRAADCRKLHREVTKSSGPYQANRTHSVLRAMFNFAKAEEIIDANPAEGIERNREEARTRFLARDELARLRMALDQYPDQTIADVFRFLLATGCRKNEALTATWTQINFDDSIWTKPANGTKQRKTHVVPLNTYALSLLRKMRERHPHSEWLFPATRKRKHVMGHLVEVRKAWEVICRNAEIEDVRIHDLRHSFASICVAAGFSLQVVAALLGHSEKHEQQNGIHIWMFPPFVMPRRA